jgi:glutaredoxin
MRIQVFTSPSCSHGEAAVVTVKEYLAEAGVEAEVEEVVTANFEDAKNVRSLGSPTVRIDGVDIEYGTTEPQEFTSECRYYNTAEGWKPSPPGHLILGAITRAGKG